MSEFEDFFFPVIETLLHKLGAWGSFQYMCGPINKKRIRKYILEYFQVKHAHNIVNRMPYFYCLDNDMDF
jgi:hypothetical protein